MFEAGEWNLLTGTNVVAANASNQDATFGVEDEVDLIANGRVFTNGTTGAGNSVYFRPETTTSVSLAGAGRDWGGLILTSESSGSALRFADIGFAANPLFLNYPNDTQIKRSRIHSFADLGVWISGTLDDGAVLDSSLVERGSTLHASLGGTGVYLDQADQASVLNSRISLVGREDDDGAVGLRIDYGETFCGTEPLYHQDLAAERDSIIGPGAAVGGDGIYVGVKTDWVCGSTDRDIDFFENTIANWMYAGVVLEQTADVQFKCNIIRDNGRGIEVYRDAEPTGSQMRFRENKVRATTADATLYGARTNNNQRLRFGANVTSLYGKNVFTVNRNFTRFIVETDADTTKILNAEDNLWFVTTASGADSSLQVLTGITDRLLASPTAAIDVDPFYDIGDAVTVCGESLGGSALPGREFALVDGGAALSTDTNGPPTVFEFRGTGPNPTSGKASFLLSVPAGRIGTYVFEMFDIQGRRISVKSETVPAAAQLRWEWKGTDDSGDEVSPGVYFARLTGPDGIRETRKVTVLR